MTNGGKYDKEKPNNVKRASQQGNPSFIKEELGP